MPTIAPYGSWRSPIGPEVVAAAGRRLAAPALAGDGAVWWAEGRPGEGGRVVLMRRPAGGEPEAVTPAGANVRTRVHEYGGGAWTLVADDLVLFVDFADQRLYRQRLGEEPVAITPEPESPAGLRYADMRLCPDGRTVVCVREVHGAGEAENQIVALPLDGSGEPAVLASGRDFYSFPRISPDGALARLDLLGPPEHALGRDRALGRAARRHRPTRAWSPAGPRSRSSSPSGTPRAGCTSSPTATAGGTSTATRAAAIEQLTAEEAELGHPQWLFGGSTYAFLDDGSIAFVRCERGEERLFVLDPGAERLRDLGLPYTSFGFPSLSARGTAGRLRRRQPRRAETAIVVYDLAERRAGGRCGAPATSRSTPPTSRPRARSSSRPAAARPPTASTTRRPTPTSRRRAGELPPLIVQSHGGPTSHATPALDREFLFWTSRGFGVVDVNYRGSSGYGRAYRERLRGDWGVVDTDDCIAAARHLAATGEVDGERLAIRGGSAGGYATLCALVFHDDFAAGASYYGVADTETLATDTHKFESRYLDGLIGPYPEQSRPLPRALADPLRRAAAGAGDPLPGPRGRGRAAEPGGDDGRRAEAPTASPTPTSPSRASSTASAARRPRSAASKPSSTSTAASSASSPPDELEPVEIDGADAPGARSTRGPGAERRLGRFLRAAFFASAFALRGRLFCAAFGFAPALAFFAAVSLFSPAAFFGFGGGFRLPAFFAGAFGLLGGGFGRAALGGGHLGGGDGAGERLDLALEELRHPFLLAADVAGELGRLACRRPWSAKTSIAR